MKKTILKSMALLSLMATVSLQNVMAEGQNDWHNDGGNDGGDVIAPLVHDNRGGAVKEGYSYSSSTEVRRRAPSGHEVTNIERLNGRTVGVVDYNEVTGGRYAPAPVLTTVPVLQATGDRNATGHRNAVGMVRRTQNDATLNAPTQPRPTPPPPRPTPKPNCRVRCSAQNL